MRHQPVLSALGKILLIVGISMLLPVLWSIYYHEEETLAVLGAAVVTLTAGLLLSTIFKMHASLSRRQGYLVVTLGWVAAAVFGTLPYLFTGTFSNFASAFFETMSGFTTTGASVLANVEAVPKGILFWRSLTHWLGGMGIMVLFVAVMSHMGVGAIQVFKAETPGATTQKLRPKIKDTARVLWLTYVGLTFLEILLLWAAGMGFFDSICHTFGTLATGGFSTKNASIGYYGPLIQWIIIVFMTLGGTNFGLLYLLFRSRSVEPLWRSEEFKTYLLFLLGATACMTLALSSHSDFAIGKAIRLSAFQVVSIVTTTGYSTANFASWAVFPQVFLFALMFVGGCNGSTGGSIKVGRHLILFKQALIQMRKVLRPRAIISVKVDDRTVDQGTVIHVLQFFFLYIVIFFIGSMLMSLMGVDLVSSLSGVAACLGNVGPGLSAVGPTQNYSFIPPMGKYLLSLLMLVGRLEIYSVFVLLVPSNWEK